MEAIDEEERRTTIFGVRFSPEVRLDTVIVALGLLGGGVVWWGDVSAQFALLKAGLAVQGETNNRIEGNIREIKSEVKETKDSMHGLERRMDRARM